ncbi:MAG TPA: peptide deformylase [Kineosporiaceae bacterium]|nr:peptide deformylase [Kineosporiaceae bacterium]
MPDAIRLFGDPVLRQPTEPVRTFDAGLRRLVDRMFEAMHAADGVGLAANQIGVDASIFVMDCEGVRAVVANPRLVDLSDEVVPDELEGCLSVPGVHYPAPRAARAGVVGVDERGEPVELHGEGYVARCFQHEVDHLDGKVYLDRLVGKVRRQALRDLRRSS